MIITFSNFHTIAIRIILFQTMQFATFSIFTPFHGIQKPGLNVRPNPFTLTPFGGTIDFHRNHFALLHFFQL